MEGIYIYLNATLSPSFKFSCLVFHLRRSRHERRFVAIMVNLFLPLLLGLATSTNAASLPKPSLGRSLPMNLTDLYSSATNATSLGDGGSAGIDPRFSVDYQLGGIPLRPIACLMNAVNAMTNLALQDFGSTVRPVVARLPSYPDVVFKSDPTGLNPGTTPVRYILWAIWSFALFVMKYDNFQTMLMTLRFNGIIVGYVTIEKPDPQVLSLANVDNSIHTIKERAKEVLPAIPVTNDLANFTEIPGITSLSLANTTTPSNTGNLRVFIKPVGHILTNIEFFVPILANLEYVARFPSTSPVNGFISNPADVDTWMEFRDFGGQPRTQAPIFEYQCIAKALGELTGYLARLGWWSEAIIVMQVDGVNVGDGWIRKRRG